MSTEILPLHFHEAQSDHQPKQVISHWQEMEDGDWGVL